MTAFGSGRPRIPRGRPTAEASSSAAWTRAAGRHRSISGGRGQRWSPQRSTETAINENFPRWARDGASIDFYSDGRLWRMPATGGPARPLTGTGVGYRSRESLDGRFLLYTKGKGVFRVAVTGGERRSWSKPAGPSTSGTSTPAASAIATYDPMARRP